jgi:hypothetical protein
MRSLTLEVIQSRDKPIFSFFHACPSSRLMKRVFHCWMVPCQNDTNLVSIVQDKFAMFHGVANTSPGRHAMKMLAHTINT